MNSLIFKLILQFLLNKPYFLQIKNYSKRVKGAMESSSSDENQSGVETIIPTTEQKTASPLPSKRVKQALEFWSSEGDYYYLQIASYVVSVG